MATDERKPITLDWVPAGLPKTVEVTSADVLECVARIYGALDVLNLMIRTEPNGLTWPIEVYADEIIELMYISDAAFSPDALDDAIQARAAYVTAEMLAELAARSGPKGDPSEA